MRMEKLKGERTLFAGVTCNNADMKLFLISLVLFCSLGILIMQFLPSEITISSSTTYKLSWPQSPPHNVSSAVRSLMKEELTSDSVVKRTLNAVGSAAYLFIQMGAYRGGPNSFAVVGLASKPLHVFAKPRFICEWLPVTFHGDDNSSVTASGHTILPDWGYGRVYTVVVVNCTFSVDVGADGTGGCLVLRATTGGGSDRAAETEERFIAMEETPGSVNVTMFSTPPRYDCLYCGSPLYGDLSPQRVREWIAYHANLFGLKSHFVIHDAGGVHRDVMEVLRPWMEKGLLTLQDVREQERFDGYYHNQFLVLNDCLHRYKFMAKWIFVFDMDEFIYLPSETKLEPLLESFSGYTQFTIEQMPMSNTLCQFKDYGKTSRMWGIEKLVYRDARRKVRRDHKYAIQPRSASATGVHLSQNVAGPSLSETGGMIKYFHYHGTLAMRRDPCRELLNVTKIFFDNTPYVLDETQRSVAGEVRMFELKMIGPRLAHTRE
ncbi:unnamed protein product [Musa acuminata subsp. burmannicoides]